MWKVPIYDPSSRLNSKYEANAEVETPKKFLSVENCGASFDQMQCVQP